MSDAPYAAGIRRSIAGRLLFWFLVIALIPCALLTAITARIATSALERAVRDTLVQTAAGKAGELEAYAAERVRDGTALARGPSILRAIRELAAVPAGGGGATTDQADYLAYAAKAFHYEQLLLIDPVGRVLFSLDPSIPVGASLVTGPLADSELAVGFDRAKTLLQSDLGGFERYGSTALPLAFVTCPALDDGRLVGVLALGLGPQRIWQTLSDFSGLGETWRSSPPSGTATGSSSPRRCGTRKTPPSGCGSRWAASKARPSSRLPGARGATARWSTTAASRRWGPGATCRASAGACSSSRMPPRPIGWSGSSGWRSSASRWPRFLA
ncbi:MAG: cache domain-containing protein [Planctomycetota bacterium]